MKRIAIVMRHGAFDPQKYNDGPLTPGGKVAIWESAGAIARMLSALPNDLHDQIGRLAFLVSGSLRGLDTYRLLMQELAGETELFEKKLFKVTDEVIRTDFFSTPDEDLLWRGLRNDPFYKEALEMNGPDEVLLTHAIDLIRGPADRVVAETKALPEEVTIIITHSPHDRLIVEGLTGTRPTDALGYGCFRICEFEQ